MSTTKMLIPKIVYFKYMYRSGNGINCTTDEIPKYGLQNMNMTDKIIIFQAKDNACYLSKKLSPKKPNRLLHVHFANKLLSSIKLPKHL